MSKLVVDPAIMYRLWLRSNDGIWSALHGFHGVIHWGGGMQLVDLRRPVSAASASPILSPG